MRQTSSGREQGQSAVEFALVLPLLLMLIFALIEFGVLFMSWVTVEHSAREATRYAVTGRSEAGLTRLESIVEVAESQAGWLPFALDSVIVRSSPNTDFSGLVEGDPGGPCYAIEVEINYTHQGFTPFIFELIPSLTLQGRERIIAEPFAPC